MNTMRKMINKATLFLVLLTVKGYIVTAQQVGRISLEFRGGLPSILTEADPSTSPFGGFGIRYSFNNIISLSADANGGAISGRSQQAGYFRNGFTQFGGKVNFNPTGFIKNRSDIWKRFNVYLSGGVNNTFYYYDKDKALDGKTSKPYFVYDAGISLRYYANEMIDVIGGVTINFSQTTAIDNIRGNSKYDNFALSYVGIAIKLLPTERKQLADWTHIPLPYNTGTMAITKQLVTNLEKDMRDMEKKGNDSVTSVFRKEIQVVDEKVKTVNGKVDSVDAKLNQVLEILNRMSTQGVNVNNSNPDGNNQAVVPVPVNPSGKNNNKNNSGGTSGNRGNSGQAGQSGNKGNQGNTNTQQPNNTTKPGTGTGNANANNNSQTGQTGNNSGSKAAVIDQSKVKENYAIVVGSFQQDQNAINTRERFIAKGWDAHILGNARSPYKRIVIFSNNYYEAAKIVTELRVSEQPDVWMLDINTGKGVYIK